MILFPKKLTFEDTRELGLQNINFEGTQFNPSNTQIQSGPFLELFGFIRTKELRNPPNSSIIPKWIVFVDERFFFR